MMLASVLLTAAGARADDARSGDAPHRVAVLPVSLLAASPETGQRVRQRLSESLAAEDRVEVQTSSQVDAAVRARCGANESWWDCLEQEENLLGVGRELGADAVVASNLAVMGETRVLKLRVVDLSTKTVSGEVVELVGADDEAVLERFLALNARLFPHEQEAEPAWYQRWEVWTVIGTGVVVAAAAGTLAAVYIITGIVDGEEERWDSRVTLP